MGLTPQHLGVEATQNWWFHQWGYSYDTSSNELKYGWAKFVEMVKDGSRFLHVLT